MSESTQHKLNRVRSPRVQITYDVESGGAAEKKEIPFIVGEQVKVNDCPFKDFVGTVQEVLPEKRRLKVTVSIFGRGTSVELDVLQVEPAEEPT